MNILHNGATRVPKDSLVRNSTFLFANTVTMAGLGFLFWVAAARLITPTEVGIAATLVSGINVISGISLVGLNITLPRFLPRSRDRGSLITSALLLSAAMALLVGIGYVVLTPSLAHSLTFVREAPMVAAAFVLFGVAATLNLLTDSIYTAYRKAQYNLLLDGVVGSGSQLLLVLTVAGSAVTVFCSVGAAACLALAGSLIVLHRRFGYRPTSAPTWAAVRPLVRYSAAAYLGHLLNLLPVLVLPVLVLAFRGSADAGFYYTCVMMANLVYTIAYAVSQALLTEGGYSETHARRLLTRATGLTLAVIVPAAAALALIGPLVLDLFGREYAAGGTDFLRTLALNSPAVAGYVLALAYLRIVRRMALQIVANAVYAVVLIGMTALTLAHGLPWIGYAWLAANLAAVATTVVGLRLTPSGRQP